MEAEKGIAAKFSRCEACNAELTGVKMDAPLYCIPCIEEMERLKMSPKRYGKHRSLHGG